MRISCFPASEEQLYQIIQFLKEAGLSSRYEEEAHGESILISVDTRSVDERERVKAIFRKVGIIEFLYNDENVA